MRHEFDKPLPGEALEEYLRRHNAHPDQTDRREATSEDIAECDRTEEFIGGAFILTGINCPQRPLKKGKGG